MTASARKPSSAGESGSRALRPLDLTGATVVSVVSVIDIWTRCNDMTGQRHHSLSM